MTSPVRKLTIGIKSTIPRLGQVIRSDCAKIPLIHELILQNNLIIKEFNEEDPQDTNCEILIADPGLVSTRIDNSFHNLQWMQCTFAGVNRLLNDSKRDNYILTRIGEGFGPQMVEYILGWILALQLRIPTAIEQKTQVEWNPSPYLTRGTLVNQTVGILGTGQIGSSIAQACRSFGLKTIGYCTNPSRYSGRHSVDSHPFDLYTDSLETIIGSSNYLVNTLPSTVHTKYLLTFPLISSILQSPSLSLSPSDPSSPSPLPLPPPLPPRSLIFMNIGRGDIIASSDLIQLLEHGHISAAVLDVFEEEPLPASHPFYQWQGGGAGAGAVGDRGGALYLTPHISALSTSEIVSQNFLKNLKIFLEVHSSLSSQLPYPVSDPSSHIAGESDNLFLQTLTQRLVHVVDRQKGY
jgi:phosphoglycerate dehydrogenase-like enzyme